MKYIFGEWVVCNRRYKRYTQFKFTHPQAPFPTEITLVSGQYEYHREGILANCAQNPWFTYWKQFLWWTREWMCKLRWKMIDPRQEAAPERWKHQCRSNRQTFKDPGLIPERCRDVACVNQSQHPRPLLQNLRRAVWWMAWNNVLSLHRNIHPDSSVYVRRWCAQGMLRMIDPQLKVLLWVLWYGVAWRKYPSSVYYLQQIQVSALPVWGKKQLEAQKQRDELWWTEHIHKDMMWEDEAMKTFQIKRKHLSWYCCFFCGWAHP